MASTQLRRFSSIKTDPLRAFKFIVEFEVNTSNGSAAVFDDRIHKFKSGFQTLNGLAINVQPIPYREGGYNTTIHQVPGMATFTPITLQRGAVFGNDEVIAWVRGLFAASAGEGVALNGNDFRLNLTVWVLDHPTTVIDGADADVVKSAAKLGFKIWNAWPSSISYSDLNAGNQGLLFESMTLVHEGLSIGYPDSNGAITYANPSSGPSS